MLFTAFPRRYFTAALTVIVVATVISFFLIRLVSVRRRSKSRAAVLFGRVWRNWLRIRSIWVSQSL